MAIKNAIIYSISGGDVPSTSGGVIFTGATIPLTYKDNTTAYENDYEYNWIINNAYEYGFILRYPKDKEYITGYNYEPWHYRYVGIDAAKVIYENNLTFEEYYSYYVENK